MAGDDYDFWLFDLDGTIVDIERSYAHEVVHEVGDRLGRSFTDREAERLWYGVGGPRGGVLADSDVDADEFWEVFHEVEDPIARAEATYIYDDAEAFIGGLDHPVGLVTHCQAYLTDPVLDHLDIADWFDVVVCCTDDTGWKPDPGPVEMALNGLGVPEDHAGALAGDNPSDVGAAWNAGLDAVHIERHGHDVRGHCVVADHRVDALDALTGQPSGSD